MIVVVIIGVIKNGMNMMVFNMIGRLNIIGLLILKILGLMDNLVIVK